MSTQEEPRDVVIIADVDALPWRKLPPAGLYSKSLSVDPVSGARTAIVRMVPQQGYVPPATAHYHDTYEEILGLAGPFTFDTEVWLSHGSYVFHPAGTVHGFASVVPEDSIFLSRVGPGHTGNSVPEPAQRQMYSIYATPDARAPASMSEPLAGAAATPRAFLGDGVVQWHEISAHPSRRHGAAMVRFPAHWRSTADVAEETFEIFTLSPGMVFADTQPGDSATTSFVRIPAGGAVPAMECTTEVLAFVTFGDI